MISSALVEFVAWLTIMGVIILTLVQVRRQHLATNSRLDELLDVTSKLARLEGFEAGRVSMESLRASSEQLDQQNHPPQGKGPSAN